MGVRQGILETRDFASDPGTFWVVDIPAGYTVASVTALNVGLSVSGNVRARLSSGGSPLTIAVRVLVAGASSSAVSDFSSGGVSVVDTGTSGLYGNCMFWNTNTLAPVTVFFENLSGGFNHRTLMFKSALSYSQLYIDSNTGATLNSGTIYVQLYKRSNVVVKNDFGTTPLADWDITGLKKNSDGAIVFSAFDLTTSDTETISGRVSPDGVSFDSGASDYRLGFVSQSQNNATLSVAATVAQTGGAAQGLCSLFLGVPVKCRTLWMSYDNRVMATDALLSMGNRETRQTEKTLRIRVSAGTINGGTGYAVKYKL